MRLLVNFYIGIMVVMAGFLALAAQTENREILFEDALYQEEVVGNLDKAITLYQQLVQEPQISRDLHAQIKLRIALCYEKLGKLAEAEKLYNNLQSEYGDITGIARFANTQLRELTRGKQITQLKDQLQTLSEFSPSLRTQLEEVIKKLQEKIQSLEKQHSVEQDKPSPVETESVAKGEQQKISEVLSLHLYHVAQNLYQQGFFIGARENLKKALIFNAENVQANELLKKVDAMLVHSEMPLVIPKNAAMPAQIESELQKSTLPFSAEVKEKLEFIETGYELEPLTRRWNLDLPKNQEPEWFGNLLRLIKSQIPSGSWLAAASMRYENGKCYVKQPPLVHEKLRSLWETLIQAKDICKIEISLIHLPPSYHFYWRQTKQIFYPIDAGVSYTFLTPELRQKITETLTKNKSHIRHVFPESFLFSGQKTICKYLQEIPMVRGYQGKMLNFHFYSQGIQLSCERDSKNPQVEMKIFVQGMEVPVEMLTTPQGPLEHPCLFEQQAMLQINTEQPKVVFIQGILSPYPDTEMGIQDKLMALVTTELFSVGDFLREKGGSKFFPTIRSKDDSLRYYDVEPWQNIKDINIEPGKSLGDEERNAFILRLIEDEIKPIKLETPLKIVQNQLVIYGSPILHQKVESFLQTLKDNLNSLCCFSLYVLSIERHSFSQLLKGWQPMLKQDETLACYSLPFAKEELMKQLQALENIKFHHTLGPYILGNTQRAGFKDCHLRSWIEGFEHGEGWPVQSKLTNIAEGIILEARPVLLSEQKGTFDLSVSLYRNKGTRESIYTLSPQVNISLKLPEMEIHRGTLHIPFQTGCCYIISGFPCNESPTRDFILLLTPAIWKN